MNLLDVGVEDSPTVLAVPTSTGGAVIPAPPGAADTEYRSDAGGNGVVVVPARLGLNPSKPVPGVLAKFAAFKP
jgi:hypothetical protein